MLRRLGVIVLALAAGLAAQDLPYGPCGRPPRKKPRRIKAGEAFPPLPLPATPLRRTERKRDPAPPTLIGKIRWGETHVRYTEGGRRIRFADWNLDPSDMQGLLRSAARRLKVRYRHQVVDLRSFHYDPARVPILYLTGARPVALPAEAVGKLREYLLKGGTLWAEACWGSASFAESFRALVQKILPGRPLLPLPPDHPLFNCMYPLARVAYSKWVQDRPAGRPYLEGVYLGCRVAVLFSPYDLSCAWDSLHVRPGSRAVVGRSAHELGLNMITYAVAYRPYARYYSRARKVLVEENPGAEFVLGQLRHQGHWDPDPQAFATLARDLMQATNVETGFVKRTVSLTDSNLTQLPFLYMTGHGDFRWSKEEQAALRHFLRGGGFLFADACCGDLAFDRAFRREIARALGGIRLAPLPASAPIYAVHNRIQSVEYTPRARALYGEATKGLPLEGITLEGALRVVYSRFDIGNGLEGVPHPFSIGVASTDARRLAVNIVVYAMTH